MGRLNKENIIRLKNLNKHYSGKELFLKVCETWTAPYRDYGKNYLSYLPSEEELEKQRKTECSNKPKISIVVPTFETKENHFYQMVDSVLNQTYQNWELCLADGSKSDQVKKLWLKKFKQEDRIKYEKLKENQGITGNTNEGLKMATGDYIGFMDHDDLLVPSALYEVEKRFYETNADMIYTDEDKVSDDLKEYMDPHFKLDFNQELLLGNNYICHFVVVSKELLNQVGELRKEYEGAQDHDFVLRCSEMAQRIEHIGKILYHWRLHPQSTSGNAGSKEYAFESGKRAIESYLKRQGFIGKVKIQRDLGFYQIRYKVSAHKTLGIYFWGEKSAEFDLVLEQIRLDLKHWGIELKLEVRQGEIPDYYLICSRNISKINANGISALLGSCSREGVAVVGAKTIRKSRVLQCGYQKDGKAFVPCFKGLPATYKGYFKRAIIASETDAVTNECAVVKGDIWKQMIETSITPEKGEEWMDWCYSMLRNGCKVIVEPQAEVRV